VIKNLGHFYRHIKFISGATILGNGTLALILDPNRVVEDALRAAGSGSHLQALSAAAPPYSLAGDLVAQSVA
jgi:chemotaxis protein histidine kinase CheA